MDIEKSDPKPLYVSRKVINADEITSWAKEQGFENLVPSDKMHVTIISSRAPVDWMKLGNSDDWYVNEEPFKIPAGGPRLVQALGPKSAPVLMFSSWPLCYRNESAMRLGASWDFKEFQPHITISYESSDVDLNSVSPFIKEIILGPEIFEEFVDGWTDTLSDSEIGKFKIIKVDDEAQMVYGWASVIKENGVDVIDTQNDIIQADELIKATTEFMKDARISLSMHQGESIGQVVHSFPLVGDLMKSLGIKSEKEGWIVGVNVHDKSIWGKVKSGELKAFSIGGSATRETI